MLALSEDVVGLRSAELIGVARLLEFYEMPGERALASHSDTLSRIRYMHAHMLVSIWRNLLVRASS